MKTKRKSEIIVSFCISNSMYMNNPGYLYYSGEADFQKLQQSAAYSLTVGEKDGKKVLYNRYGFLATEDDLESKIGILDIDGLYYTLYCKYIEDCSIEELRLIRESTYEKSDKLLEYLNQLDSKRR